MTDVIHMTPKATTIRSYQSDSNHGSLIQLASSDLDYLKQNGVSSRVIAEMQAARGPSPLATRVVGPPSTTVIYEQPYYPPPVYVGPVYGPPRPVIWVGGRYHRCN